MASLEKRLERLEQANAERVRVVVVWDEDPEPPGEDVIVIDWEDAINGEIPVSTPNEGR